MRVPHGAGAAPETDEGGGVVPATAQRGQSRPREDAGQVLGGRRLAGQTGVVPGEALEGCARAGTGDAGPVTALFGGGQQQQVVEIGAQVDGVVVEVVDPTVGLGDLHDEVARRV